MATCIYIPKCNIYFTLCTEETALQRITRIPSLYVCECAYDWVLSNMDTNDVYVNVAEMMIKTEICSISQMIWSDRGQC